MQKHILDGAVYRQSRDNFLKRAILLFLSFLAIMINFLQSLIFILQQHKVYIFLLI
jgi:hypothetical protein